MCGRYTLHTTWEELVTLYHIHERPNIRPRYNMALTHDVLAVRLSEDGQQELVNLRWGPIPPWPKHTKIGDPTINARIETIASKANEWRTLVEEALTGVRERIVVGDRAVAFGRA